MEYVGTALTTPFDFADIVDDTLGIVDFFVGDFIGNFGQMNLTDPFRLFEVTFTAIQTSPTSLDLFGGINLDFVDVSTTVEAVAVPEPGTLAFFGIGLLGLGLARRRIA